jgi:hypothetical protein
MQIHALGVSQVVSETRQKDMTKPAVALQTHQKIDRGNFSGRKAHLID